MRRLALAMHLTEPGWVALVVDVASYERQGVVATAPDSPGAPVSHIYGERGRRVPYRRMSCIPPAVLSLGVAVYRASAT